MGVQRCKGMRDLSPAEMTVFRLIEGTFRDSCLKWGYEEVRTPALEYLHLFTSTGTLTPGMLSKVYSFLDWDGWSGERVVLRPDGTIPIARLYIDNMSDRELARLYYVTSIFIFEETGKETREKWQCGAELIGKNSTIADVELIALALEVLERLGLKDVKLRLSHAGLIRALLAALGLSGEEQAIVFDQILDGDLEALSKVKSGKPKLGKALTPLLGLEGKSSGFLRNLRTLLPQDSPELEPSIDDFIKVVDLLEAMGCDCQIDIASGKGFEYYTGIMFQMVIGQERVGGGGRYDALIPLMGGKDIPASGFALYLDRLMKLVKSGNLPKTRGKKILVKTEPGTIKEGFSIANRLHEIGCVAELNLSDQAPAGLEWTLEVRSKAPQFVLTDQAGRRKAEAPTIEEVLAIIGGGG